MTKITVPAIYTQADLDAAVAAALEEALAHEDRCGFVDADTIRAIITPEQSDALDAVKRAAYRKGWAFAFRQWQRTGSVPDPDYRADAIEKGDG